MRMYKLLYDAWLKEKKNREVQKLPENFYVKIAEYMRKLRKEGRMLDEKSVKARVLRRKTKNVEAMVKELLWLRWEKIVRKALEDRKIPENALTLEEQRWSQRLVSLFEDFESFCDKVLMGKIEKPLREQPSMMVLRFLEDVPALVGADMRTYGPFKAEDVATLPFENARILIRRGVAVKVELDYTT